jgi:hypothetical protein
MPSLLTAIVAASKKVADPMAKSYASGNRILTVRISRPGAAPTFNRTTQRFTNPSDAEIYLGPARIRPATGGAQVEVAGEDTTYTSVAISIDGGGTAPRIDDLVQVIDNAVSRGAHLADRVFTVVDVEVGGHFDIGYALRAVGAEPSRRT